MGKLLSETKLFESGLGGGMMDVLLLTSINEVNGCSTVFCLFCF